MTITIGNLYKHTRYGIVGTARPARIIDGEQWYRLVDERDGSGINAPESQLTEAEDYPPEPIEEHWEPQDIEPTYGPLQPVCDAEHEAYGHAWDAMIDDWERYAC